MPVKRISITTSRTEQTTAAITLSGVLTELNLPHAYIGGFAWAMLGSDRQTQDIDVLLQVEDSKDVFILRERLSELNKHFALAGLKLYYVRELKENLSEEDLVYEGTDNVLIETLQTGKLGLPRVAEPLYPIEVENETIYILDPGVLILTKMKRWYLNVDSTRPATMSKNFSDAQDLMYLVQWMAERDLTIGFQLYQGKTRDDLLKYVHKFHERISSQDEGLGKALKKVMKPEDWNSLHTPPQQMPMLPLPSTRSSSQRCQGGG